MSIQHQMNLKSWGLLILLSILWGGSFFFVEVAVGHVPPLTIVLVRVALAAAFLWAMAGLLRAPIPRTGAAWRAFLGMGVLNNVIPFCLIVWGQTEIASGVASILNATTPLFGVVVAHVLTADEKLTPLRLAGVVAGIAGVTVMMIGAGFGGGMLGYAAVLAAAFSYSLAGVYGRRFRALGVAPMATAAGQVTCSSLLLLPVVLVVDRPWALAWPGGEVALALVGLAVLSTGLAYILYFRLLAVAGATNLLLVTFLIPVSAILLGALVLGESLGPRHVA
ncbi:MAG: DMT family transporter, partial [Pseudomonadota bacterium]